MAFWSEREIVGVDEPVFVDVGVGQKGGREQVGAVEVVDKGKPDWPERLSANRFAKRKSQNLQLPKQASARKRCRKVMMWIYPEVSVADWGW